MEYFFSCFKKNGFKNWSENIHSRAVDIKYPCNNDEIKKYIKSAKKNSQIIRVCGSKHSVSPAVMNSSESNILILSLEKYKLEPKNIQLDHSKKLVTVNAGWKLGQLYDVLNKYNYFLETQPASSAFSVAGVVCMPVHGARLGASLLSDTVVSITLIDENCNEIVKNDTDTDFDLYRLSLGMLGIITSVTFNIVKMSSLDCKICSCFNIFQNVGHNNYRVKRELIESFLIETVNICLNPNPKSPQYRQCFIDYHNDVLLAMDWKASIRKKPINKELNSTDIYKLKIAEFIFDDIDKNFRENSSLLGAISKATRYDIQFNVEDNMQQNRDMFWLFFAARAIFMSYFIPIYYEDEGMKLDNFYEAVRYVKNLVVKFKNMKRKFNIDLPSDLRFVVSDNKSKLSPIYSEKKMVFVSLELVCTAFNLETDSSKISIFDKKINKDFRKFFKEIEQKWLSLGGRVHWAKVFGFSSQNGDPFDCEMISEIIDDSLKKDLESSVQNLFINKFVSNLIK
jgi:FAD/FMN-containing dehydrogenase